MSAESTTGLPSSELRGLANIDREYSSIKTSKVVGVVLVILALLVAVGAAVLIATSGGPTNALLFYGGVALGTVALGSFLLAATLLIRAGFLEKKLEKKIVSPEKILNDMLNTKELDEEYTRGILEKMDPDCRVGFLEFADVSYDEHSDIFKTILRAIVAVETPGYSTLDLTVPFIKALLTECKLSGCFSSHVAAQLVDLLIKEGEFNYLPMHPTPLACYCADKLEDEKSFDHKLVFNIFQCMDTSHKATFYESLLLYLNENTKSRDFLRQSISKTINAEFAKSFDNDSADLDRLVGELLQWPKLVGKIIASQEEPQFWDNLENMMDSFDTALQGNASKRSLFFAAMQDVLEKRDSEELGNLWIPLINKIWDDSSEYYAAWIDPSLAYAPKALAWVTISTGKIGIRFIVTDLSTQCKTYFDCLKGSEAGRLTLVKMLKQEIAPDWKGVCPATHYLRTLEDSEVKNLINNEEIFQGYVKMELEGDETESS